MSVQQKAKYRVGMIGGGRMGTHYARAYVLNPMTEVVAVADTDIENRELFCHRFNVPGYDSYEEMFKNESIDIAAPVLPVRANANAVIASARAGVKAIFCEKPLTATVADADRMVEECRSRGILFAAGLVGRNYPEYWAARRLIESGEIGEVQSMNIYHGNEQGGVHGVNMALHFAGNSDADWVVGWVEGDPFGDTEEEFKRIGGYIRFSNGIEAFSHYKDTVKGGIEVIGSRGVFYHDDRGPHLLKVNGTGLKEIEGLFENTYSGGVVRYDDEGWRRPTPGMKASVQKLVDSLEKGVGLQLTTGDDLRKSLEICIAMRESHRHGHSPIKLPLPDRSLTMRPMLRRWSFKVETMGREAYRADMAAYIKPSGDKQ